MNPLWLLLIIPAASCVGFMFAALLAAVKEEGNHAGTDD